MRIINHGRILTVFWIGVANYGLASELPPLARIGAAGLLQAELIYPLEGRQTPECHASTVAETPTGLVAAWFGGAHEKNPDVGIWISRHIEDRWMRPVLVADGSEGEDQDYACWNPVLFQPRAGPLMLFYKVGLEPRRWWGVVVTSNDGGESWSPPRKLGTNDLLPAQNRNLLGPVKNKPIALSDGTLLCPSSTENDGWRVHFEQTRDLGQTWEVTGPINDASKFNAIQPTILTHADGRLQALCRTQEDVIVESWSEDNGRNWSPLTATSLPNPNAGFDGVSLADGRLLLVYNHSVRRDGLSGRQNLNVALSDDGEHWEIVLTLENDGDRTGYSYPAAIQASDGKVHVTYTWRCLSIKHVVLDTDEL